MKKYLSLLLAIMMVLSTVSFAAPAMTGVVNSASEETETVPEAIETEAELSAQENLGQLIAKVDFQKIEVGTKYEYTSMASKPNLNNMGYIADNLPEGFPENIVLDLYDHTSVSVAEDESGNKYGKYVLGEKAGFSKLGLTAANASQTSEASFPAGSYTFKISLTAVSKTALDGTVTNYTSPEGCSAIAFFKNNSGVTFNNERYTDLASPGTSRGMISSNVTSGTTTKIKGTITYTDSCDVQFRSTQPKFKFAGFTTFHSMISFDANSAKERVYYVDDIELYYKPVAEVVDINFYDVRKGYIDITVNKVLPEIKTIADANKAFIKSNTSTLFDSGLDIITNEDGTVTYRLYENDFLANRTVNLNTVYQSPDYGVLILKPGKTASYSYKALDMTNYDGENMVANGDFSNPYYTGAISGKTCTTYTIDNGLTFTLSSTNTKWLGQNLQAIPLTTAKYFIELEMEHLSDAYVNLDDDETNDVASSYNVAIYLPFPNNNANFSIGGKYTSSPAHIPSSANLGAPPAYSISGAAMKTNKKFTYKRMLDISGLVDGAEKYNPDRPNQSDFPVADLSKIPLTFQITLDKNTTFSENPALADGISFKINGLSLKKMFEASFTDGTTTEKLDIAKDIEFILPSTLGGKNVSAWLDENGNKYNAGSLYTPTVYVEEGIEFTPVYEHDPKNQHKTSIRFSDPSGIRFLASVTKEQKNKLDEYGFVVTTKAILDSKGLENDALAFGAGFAVVSGACYNKEGGLDKIFEISETDVFFTGVVYGIPEDQYNAPLVVRPYTKVGDTYYYGETSQASILDVMKKIRDGGYKDVNEEQAQICKSILFKYGEYLYETEEGYVLFEDDAENGNWAGLTGGWKCKAELVTDPVNPDNSAYYVTHTELTDKHCVYLMSSTTQKFQLEENCSYMLTYDVYLEDKNLNGAPITQATMSGALEFTGANAVVIKAGSPVVATANAWCGIVKNGKVVYSGTDTNTAVNWKTDELNAADTNSGINVPAARFGIYANHVGGYGCSYYVDNIKFIKLK